MKIKVLTFLAGILVSGLMFPATMRAQNEIEGEMKYSGFFDSYYRRGPLRITAGAGLAGYRGDLCEELNCNERNFNFNVGVNYQMFPRVVLGAEFNHFKLGAKDVHEERNLTFAAEATEFMLFGRLRIIEDIMRQPVDRSDKPKPFKPFLLTGIGMTFYNANSQYIEVPEGEEQLRTDNLYNFTLAIPAGIGFSVRINPQFAVIAQGAYRFTPTDQLDDVGGELGNNTKNDGYATAGLKIRFTPGAPSSDNAAFSPPSSSGGGGSSSDDGGSSGDSGGGSDKSNQSPDSKSSGDDSTGDTGSEEQKQEEKSEEEKQEDMKNQLEQIKQNDNSQDSEEEEEDDSGGGGGWGDDSGGDSGDDSGGGGGW